MDVAILIMEIIGTIAFAFSGAMVGIQKKFDLFGVIVLGMTTSVGGGLIRDLLIGNHPPKMFQHPLYAMLGIVISIITFFVVYFQKNMTTKYWIRFGQLMFLFDTVGLGIFTVMGVTTAIDAGFLNNYFLQIFVGILTGVGGGLLRDIMARNLPYIFVKHIYACACLLGSISFILVNSVMGQLAAMIVGALMVILIRLLASYYKWNLPRIQSLDIEETGVL